MNNDCLAIRTLSGAVASSHLSHQGCYQTEHLDQPFLGGLSKWPYLARGPRLLQRWQGSDLKTTSLSWTFQLGQSRTSTPAVWKAGANRLGALPCRSRCLLSWLTLPGSRGLISPAYTVLGCFCFCFFATAKVLQQHPSNSSPNHQSPTVTLTNWEVYLVWCAAVYVWYAGYTASSSLPSYLQCSCN